MPLWLRHASKFAVVGVLAAGIDYLVLLAMIGLGAAAGPARIPATAVALVFTWAMNRRLTFATRAAPSWAEFGRYALAAIKGIGINLAIYWGALWLGATVALAFVAGTGTAAIFTFLCYRELLHDR